MPLMQRERINFAAVVAGERLLGQLSASHVDELLSSRFGFALYARRSVTEVMQPPTTCVTIGQPITDVLAAVNSRSARGFTMM